MDISSVNRSPAPIVNSFESLDSLEEEKKLLEEICGLLQGCLKENYDALPLEQKLDSLKARIAELLPEKAKDLPEIQLDGPIDRETAEDLLERFENEVHTLKNEARQIASNVEFKMRLYTLFMDIMRRINEQDDDSKKHSIRNQTP